jgi:hypothetical protein
MKQLQERAEFLLCVSPGGLSLHARTKSGARTGPNLGQTVADGGDDAVVRVALLWHVVSTLGNVIFSFSHRSHFISFTRAQGIPKCKIGLGKGKGWDASTWLPLLLLSPKVVRIRPLFLLSVGASFARWLPCARLRLARPPPRLASQTASSTC